MKNIKIRFWVEENKKMIEGTLEYWFKVISETGKNPFNKKIIPLLWTSLKDKNGKEIYEGDIVKSVSEYTVPFTMKIDDIGPYGIEPFIEVAGPSDGIVQPEELEVIGNIYENPELLK